jgi:hypothetical protein
MVSHQKESLLEKTDNPFIADPSSPESLLAAAEIVQVWSDSTNRALHLPSENLWHEIQRALLRFSAD